MRLLLSRYLVGCLLVLVASRLAATETGAVRTERAWRPLRPAADLPRPGMKLLQETINISEPRIRAGDDPAWADPGYDDLGWEVKQYPDQPAHTGIFWVRVHLRVSAPEQLPPGFRTEAVGAREVFWDGQRVAGSGTPGMSREAEEPGPLSVYGTVTPAMRAPGEHVVAFRMSTYRNGFLSDRTPLSFLLLDPDIYQTELHWRAIYSTAATGACLMLALTAGLMWLLAARRASVLLLGGLCLSAAVMQGITTGRAFLLYRYDWYHLIVNLRMLAGVLAGVLLLGSVVAQFGIRWRYWWLAALPFFYGPVRDLELTWVAQQERYFLAGCVALALGAAVWAMLRRKRGARLAAGGLLVSSVLLFSDPVRYAGIDFLWAFFPMAAGLISALALDIHHERQQARQAQLTAARMELELLKKNIQPHFLLNTLATIIETIEQEPATAVALVEALAGEFRILSRVAGQQQIPLAQELELCRAHLQVMALRRSVQGTLDAAGVEAGALVPPALFHTLIENGLTHLMPVAGRLDFELRGERLAGATRYTLLARGRRQDERPGEPVRSGTGLRYVQARLEESYPGRWSVAGAPAPEGWRTVIEIRDREEGGNP